MLRRGEPFQPEPARACSRAVGLRVSAACSGATLALHSYADGRMVPCTSSYRNIHEVAGFLLTALSPDQAPELKHIHDRPHHKVGGAWRLESSLTCQANRQRAEMSVSSSGLQYAHAVCCLQVLFAHMPC